MDKKKIYVIVEYCGYDSEGYDCGGSTEIEAYENKEDAMLALWYWYCDQLNKGLDAEFDEECGRVYSEGTDMLSTTLDRSICEIDLYI